MLYAETSAVLRWLLGDVRGDEVRGLLAGAKSVYTSRLTLAEARRALVRLSMDGKTAEAREAARELAIASAHWTIIEILPEIVDRADQPFPVEWVRTLDALHLATALYLAKEIGPLSMLSTDRRILDNAPRLGFDLALR